MSASCSRIDWAGEISPETSRLNVSTDTRVVAATWPSGGSVVTRTRLPSSTCTNHFPPPSPVSS